MKNTKKTGIVPAIIIGVILLSSPIMAFGVAVPYWDSPEWYPLKLAPGESKIVQLVLQNTGEEEMIVEATIDGNIAELKDSSNEYLVEAGEINKPVNIKIEIPKKAKIGETYKIYSSFQQVSSGEGGMIRMAGAFTVNFPVEVVEKEKSELFNGKKPFLPFIIFGALLLGVIAIAIVKSRKKKK